MAVSDRGEASRWEENGREAASRRDMLDGSGQISRYMIRGNRQRENVHQSTRVRDSREGGTFLVFRRAKLGKGLVWWDDWSAE
jgi:hypothetical protein